MLKEFTWRTTPSIVKQYFVELLGPDKAAELMKAMERCDWIVVDGPHGPTGKTTLVDILVAIGYTRVIEGNFSTTIQVDKPLSGRREKSDIFESLGIAQRR